MNSRVEKSEFLDRYVDKESASNENPGKSAELASVVSSDPFVISGECGTCPKTLSTEEVLPLVIKCVNFAAVKHSNQRRKDIYETPYINHPIGVANILTSEGAVYEPVVMIAALLHDTVEDTETTFEEIEKEFGQTVRNIVAEVTDDKTLPKAERKRLQIVNSKNHSREAKLVILADKIYNLRDTQKGAPIGWSDTRVREYFQWAKKVTDNCRGTNEGLERSLDNIFVKQCKDTRKNCKCTKTLDPECAESYLSIA